MTHRTAKQNHHRPINQEAQMKSLNNKVALITGAGSGIGRAIANVFADYGTHLLLADINEAALKETKAQLISPGVRIETLAVNISCESEVQRMTQQALDYFGHFDFAINNAGISHPGKPLEDFTESDWDRVMSVNLKGVWLCMKHELPFMKTRNSGVIVNIASVAGLLGTQGTAIYSASKHGVVGLTKCAALENAASGIRVNAICPGITDTPILNDSPAVAQSAADTVPLGRLAAPEEIAQNVAWLCSDLASYVTGHTMVVDGGYSVQ
jgi:NAD(P)-dependent dehydrogenase (short-subunit alcohol dehydrogenase family)